MSFGPLEEAAIRIGSAALPEIIRWAAEELRSGNTEDSTRARALGIAQALVLQAEREKFPNG